MPHRTTDELKSDVTLTGDERHGFDGREEKGTMDGSGTIYSTTEDLYKLDRALYLESLL
jgi:hypothetical protein